MDCEAGSWKGIEAGEKGVTFVKGALQDLQPRNVLGSGNQDVVVVGKAGYVDTEFEKQDSTFDIILCQWCLGHLSDEGRFRDPPPS